MEEQKELPSYSPYFPFSCEPQEAFFNYYLDIVIYFNEVIFFCTNKVSSDFFIKHIPFLLKFIVLQKFQTI